MAQALCQLGRRFARCHNEAPFQCQYCARAFCSDHSYFVQGYDAVCSRKECVLKHDDLARHLIYRRAVEQRNRIGLCGLDDCSTPQRVVCSLCRGRFCADHVFGHMYPFKDGLVTIEQPVSVCEECWDRRKIWHSA